MRWLMVASGWILCWPCVGQTPVIEPRAWSPEVQDAWQYYYEGEYVAAQAACQRVRAAARTPEAGRDAAVLQAMALMRMPARADRLEGLGRLAQLAADDASLWEEPECNLAYGLAQLGVHETAHALDALDLAVAGFAARGQTARLQRALVALAQGWAEHSEWEVTPSHFGVSVPDDPTDVQAVRRAQIEALRARLRALPDSGVAEEETDLILARVLLGSGATRAEGVALLEGLAARRPWTATRAEAARALAEEQEQRGRIRAALELYERLGEEWQGAVAEAARARSRALQQPEMELTVPASAACGAAVAVSLRVRGLRGVDVEVRAVDLEAWLRDPRLRGHEAQLPVTGALHLARQLDTEPAAPLGWWSSEVLEEPLAFQAGPGAYVVMASGTEGGGGRHVVKRLTLVTDLLAACALGSRAAVVWAYPRPGAAADVSPADLHGRFWMQRSFAPTAVTFEGRSAQFALPGEAFVMRERAWVCLVQAGEQVALCRGELPEGRDTRDRTPRVALWYGPPEPRIGARLHIAGRVLGDPVPSVVELSCVDALEEVVLTAQVPVSAAGVFELEREVAPTWAGRHLRVIARMAGRVLETVSERVAVHVPRTDRAEFMVGFDVPPHLEPGARLRGRVWATYPWGSAPRRAKAECQITAVRLPTADRPFPEVRDAIFRAGRLDSSGGLELWVPADALDAGGPTMVVLHADVSTWEGRRGTHQERILVGAAPAHAWLTPWDVPVRAGENAQFALGWFEPGGRAVPGLPDVEVHGPGEEVQRLPVHAAEFGALSEPWRPRAAGRYEARAQLLSLDHAPLEVETAVEVLPAAAACDGRVWPRVSAQATSEPAAVEVAVADASGDPLLLLVEADEPLGGAVLNPAAGESAVRISLRQPLRSAARLWAIDSGAQGAAQVLAEVEPAREEARALTLSATPRTSWPGAQVRVVGTLTGAATGDGSALLRLIAVRPLDYGLSDASMAVMPALSVPRGTVHDSQGGAFPLVPEAGGVTRRGFGLVADEGVTHWVHGATLAELQSGITVPLPDRPGLYRMSAVLDTPDGRRTDGTLLIDARRGVELGLDVPQPMVLGDRSIVAVRITNRLSEEIAAGLHFDAGAGLHVESLRVLRAGERGARTMAAGPIDIPVSAGGTVWVHAEVEAAAVGASEFRARVTAAGGERDAARWYEVLAVPEEPRAASVEIRRSFSVWTTMEEDAEAPSGPMLTRTQLSRRLGVAADAGLVDDPEPTWFWAPLEAGGRVMPGQYVLVREEVRVAEDLPALLWSQQLPATCFTVFVDPAEFGTLGPRHDRRADRLTYRVAPHAAGDYVHEYFLAVARPGVGLLPPPRLEADAGAIPVRMAGEARPIVVTPGP